MEITESGKVTDLAYLSKASHGNKAFIKEMIQIFLRQTPGFINELKELGKKQDWIEFRKIMHKVKPTTLMMGMASIQPVISNIEICSKEAQNLDKFPEYLNTFEQICQQAFLELSEELKSI